jgi:ethanolaminephosphotransferase
VREFQDITNSIAELAVAFFDLMTLFLLTQTKAQNIPLYFLFRLQYFFLSRSSHSIPRPQSLVTFEFSKLIHASQPSSTSLPQL